VVAEGVEDDQTRRLLVQAGCDAAQGWLVARPMPSEQLVAWLENRRPRLRARIPEAFEAAPSR